MNLPAKHEHLALVFHHGDHGHGEDVYADLFDGRPFIRRADSRDTVRWTRAIEKEGETLPCGTLCEGSTVYAFTQAGHQIFTEHITNPEGPGTARKQHPFSWEDGPCEV